MQYPAQKPPTVHWYGPKHLGAGVWGWTRSGDPSGVYVRSSSKPPGAIGVPWWTEQSGFYPKGSVGWWRTQSGSLGGYWDLVCWAPPGARTWTCPNTASPVLPPVPPGGGF